SSVSHQDRSVRGLLKRNFMVSKKNKTGKSTTCYYPHPRSYVYLGECNKLRAIYYREGGEKKFKSAEKAKINSQYHQQEVITPIYPTEIPALYGTDKNQVW
ncbi:hypothetical protein L9F63_010163, partial [Diploptera punctata]